MKNKTTSTGMAFSNNESRPTIAHFGVPANDMETYFKELRKAAKFRKLKIIKLGQIGKDPLLFLTPLKNNKDAKPHLLIAAGFHGEEPAGVWGLLDFLCRGDDKFFKDAHISFLPAVNPSGLRALRRTNDQGENPNRGFCPASTDQPHPSLEGRLLIKNLSVLLQAGRDGFISLHEDEEMKTFYLFTFEKTETPGIFSDNLRQAELLFFPQQPDGLVESSKVENGIVFKECDGSFEDRLFHEGVPFTACTETPGRYPIDIRVQANRKITESFINFFIRRTL